MMQPSYFIVFPSKPSLESDMSAQSYHQQSVLPPASSGTQQPQTKAFDFTKRKKWADLLVNELSGAIMLVVSSTSHIIFCGEAANELVGWKDEVLDVTLIELIHPDDRSEFTSHFHASLQDRSELAIFVRFQNKSPIQGTTPQAHWPMYEIRGHPHFDNQTPNECICFFLMARPHPSRNSAMLDFFLELKINNEMLRQQLLDLRSSSNTDVQGLGRSASSNTLGGSPTHDGNDDADAAYQPRSIQGLSLPLAHPRLLLGSSDPLSMRIADGETLASANRSRRNTTGPDEEVDDGTGKRRKKKSQTAEHNYVCVTCGRTDSPEWRKGPLGPKTLCNACGLRHSKRTKKKVVDDQETPSTKAQEPSQTQFIVTPQEPSSSHTGGTASLEFHSTPPQPPANYGMMGVPHGVDISKPTSMPMSPQMGGSMPSNPSGFASSGHHQPPPIQTSHLHAGSPDDYSNLSYVTSSQSDNLPSAYQDFRMMEGDNMR